MWVYTLDRRQILTFKAGPLTERIKRVGIILNLWVNAKESVNAKEIKVDIIILTIISLS